MLHTIPLLWWIMASACGAYAVMRWRAVTKQAQQPEGKRLPSLPSTYALYAALWVGVPAALILMALGLSSEGAFLKTVSPHVILLLVLCLVLGGAYKGWQALQRQDNVRQWLELNQTRAMILCTLLTMGCIVVIVGLLAKETFRFFDVTSVADFFLGSHWLPTAHPPEFGALSLLWGTLFITTIALVVAIPLGVMGSIYIAYYVTPLSRSLLKPILETMAGIPTVVYGFFAAIIVAPELQHLGVFLGLAASSQSALAAGLVLGVMLIPMLISLCDDILSAVPRALNEGSLGLGATQAETLYHVILPAAFPSLLSAFLLTFSRAIGETMLVVMAAGLTANLTANPFQSVTTVTVQIVALLTGDQNFDAPPTLAAFALGFSLFGVTLIINIMVERLQRRQII